MKRTFTSLGLLVGLTCLMGASPIYQDEFACEQALEKLSQCCGPDAQLSQVSCNRDRDCNSANPDISQTRSDRIRAMSCDEIARAGYCLDPVDNVGDMR